MNQLRSLKHYLGEDHDDPSVLTMSERREAAAEFLEREEGWPKEAVKFTCDDCSEQGICQWAFDPWNIDGDCLADK